MKRFNHTIIVFILLLSLIVPTGTLGQRRHAATALHRARVLLIPLDERPPCLQFPVMMGLISVMRR